LWREKKRGREQDANINRRGDVRGSKKKKKKVTASQHCRKERGPWGDLGCRRGATGPQGPGTHCSSHSRRCQETLLLQMLLSPSLLPSSSVSPVTCLSSTQEKTCMSCSSNETRLPRHTASLSNVLFTGTGQRERERGYDERAAEQIDQEGIIESSRLEKTSEIIKSNCQHINIMPAKPCPEVPYLHIF